MAGIVEIVVVSLLVLGVSVGPFMYGMYLTIQHHKKRTSTA